MSLKEQTLLLLEAVPDDSSAWSKLHEDARLLQAIAEAEADVRDGRMHSLADVNQHFEAKWENRRTLSR